MHFSWRKKFSCYARLITSKFGEKKNVQQKIQIFWNCFEKVFKKFLFLLIINQSQSLLAFEASSFWKRLLRLRLKLTRLCIDFRLRVNAVFCSFFSKTKWSIIHDFQVASSTKISAPPSPDLSRLEQKVTFPNILLWTTFKKLFRHHPQTNPPAASKSLQINCLRLKILLLFQSNNKKVFHLKR